MPLKSLHDRVAIVTGASSGIGRATALALAREGAHVALAARRREALEKVAAEVRALGRQGLVVCADVSDRDDVRRLVGTTLETFGRVNILVANAGVYVRCPVAELDLDCIQEAMAVNFYGALYPTLELLPHLLAHRDGHLVYVSSMDARKGLPLDTPYVISKYAMRGLSEMLYTELRGTGVDVTGVYPGRVDTPLIAHLRVPWISPKMAPERVAAAIVRGMKRRRRDVIPGVRERALDLANALAPRLTDALVRALGLQGREHPPG